MAFECDAQNGTLSLARHGVSFEEASTALLDPHGFDGDAIEHSSREPRRPRLAEGRRGWDKKQEGTIPKRRGNAKAWKGD